VPKINLKNALKTATSCKLAYFYPLLGGFLPRLLGKIPPFLPLLSLIKMQKTAVFGEMVKNRHLKRSKIFHGGNTREFA
jgi:hypothetical protein